MALFGRAGRVLRPWLPLAARADNRVVTIAILGARADLRELFHTAVAAHARPFGS